MNGRTDERMNEWLVDGKMDDLMDDRWIEDGWTQMDGRINK